MTASASGTSPARTPALALAVILLTGALAAPASAAPSRALPRPALPASPSCASLLSYARQTARRTGGRTGVPTRTPVMQAQLLESPPSVTGDAITAQPP